jgi:hypothetical protein
VRMGGCGIAVIELAAKEARRNGLRAGSVLTFSAA